MTGDNVSSVKDAIAEKEGKELDPRQRSTIGFPYNNLNDAIEIAKAVHDNVGTASCDDAQLAPWVKMSPNSSGYRIQIAAARMFGLVESVSGQHKLTDLGRSIVDRQQERKARAEAFLRVPLHNALYNKYKGNVIPPAAALEREIVLLGVAEKQKERARQIFEKSADQAGFFEHGRDRLVLPGVVSHGPIGPSDPTLGKSLDPPLPPAPPPPPPTGPTHHPFIEGLLKTLPEPDTDWAAAGRIKWLQTAANIFDLMYKGDGGGIKVEAAMATRSPRPEN
jgi:hypothetical protein